jgi:hypothetical protein
MLYDRLGLRGVNNLLNYLPKEIEFDKIKTLNP